MSALTSTKNYFLRRMDSVNAWLGTIGLIGEIFLHRDSSTLMIVFFLTLIFVPDGNFSELFKGWATGIRTADSKHEARNRPAGGFTPPRN